MYLLVFALCIVFSANGMELWIKLKQNDSNFLKNPKALSKLLSLLDDKGVDNRTLLEVARGKATWQSSTHSIYLSKAAVDGNLDTFTHTKKDANPYLFIDLGKVYDVKRVDVVNRKPCCSGERLHDLDIFVGKTLNTLYLCAHFKGPAKNGDHLKFECNPTKKARYVKLMIRGTEYLHVSEVEVYAVV